MRDLTARLGVAALVASSLLAALAVLSSARLLDPAFRLTIYLLANAVFFLDFVDFSARLAGHRRKEWGALPPGRARSALFRWAATFPVSVPLVDTGLTPRQKRRHLKPYALLVSVYNAEDEIDDFVEAMETLRDRLWIIDDGSVDGTRDRLVHAGCRCQDGRVNRKKPGALRQLLASLPAEIETVLILDPDTVLRDGDDPVDTLEAVLFDFQKSGMASLCPRITVRDEGFLTRFQALEYALCSFGRKTLGDRSTNAGLSIYRRDALERALREHSLSVYAEDLENSLILLGSGERIYYDERLVFETKGKQTWLGWLSQRVGWSYGLIRVYARRFADVRRAGRGRLMAGYHYLIYAGVFQLLFHPLRLVSLALVAASFANGLDELLGLEAVPDGGLTAPSYFLAVYVKYTALALLMLTVALPPGERRDLVTAVPFYVFYQLVHIVAQTLGFANWLSLRLAGRRVFRDHYQDEDSLGMASRES